MNGFFLHVCVIALHFISVKYEILINSVLDRGIRAFTCVYVLTVCAFCTSHLICTVVT
jgi:hypothetical protein